MADTAVSQNSSAITINDIDGLRTAGRQLVQAGADIANIQKQVNVGDAIAQAMPNSAIAAAAPTADDGFKSSLDATSKWPTDIGSKILDAVSSVTGQDELAAAGLAQIASQGEPIQTGQGSSQGAGSPSAVAGIPEGKIDTSKVAYDKADAGTSEADMRNYIGQALDKKGITDPAARKRWTDGYLTMMKRESSYNANAVNTSDSNATGAAAADGNPANCSRGLAQCIPSTFASYHQAGTSANIYDPVANIAASMNYVQDRYGVSNDASNLASNVQQANSNASAQGY